MKKIMMMLMACFFAMYAHAQFFGAFYENDPDAWFDKEPFFACQNNYTYYGYGQSLQNITVVVNSTDYYSFPYVWEYGAYIVLGKENGFEFSSGDQVAMYCGNQFIGSWTYQSASAYHGHRIRTGKSSGKILSKALKFIKKIRL